MTVETRDDGVNDDLVGYEFTDHTGDPPASWIVDGTDRVLGANYVHMSKKGAPGFGKVQVAGVVRRRKQIEAGL